MRKLRVAIRSLLFLLSLALAVGTIVWRASVGLEYKLAFGSTHRFVVRLMKYPGWRNPRVRMLLDLTICRNCRTRFDHVEGCDWRAPHSSNAFDSIEGSFVSGFPPELDMHSVRTPNSVAQTSQAFDSVVYHDPDWSRVAVHAPQRFATAVLVSPLLLLSCIEFVRWRRRRRRVGHGLCLVCGYDLQGLPEPRCPECGRKFDGVRDSSGEQKSGDADAPREAVPRV